MDGYILAILVGLIAVGGAYNQDSLPQSAEDFITNNVPGANYIKPESEPAIEESEPEPVIEEVIEEITVPDYEEDELEALQQEAINDSELLVDRIKITFGKIQVIRDCESDIDCLIAYPGAGLSIQCSESEGTCYKFEE